MIFIAKDNNGEFKGETKVNIQYLREDIKEIKQDIHNLTCKVDIINTKLTVLDARSAIFGAGAAFAVTIVAQVLIMIFVT